MKKNIKVLIALLVVVCLGSVGLFWYTNKDNAKIVDYLNEDFVKINNKWNEVCEEDGDYSYYKVEIEPKLIYTSIDILITDMEEFDEMAEAYEKYKKSKLLDTTELLLEYTELADTVRENLEGCYNGVYGTLHYYDEGDVADNIPIKVIVRKDSKHYVIFGADGIESLYLGTKVS